MPAANATATEVVAGLAPVADRYDIILCDVWGVLHDGVAAFPEAGDALARFRAAGGTVVLITNAPRPHTIVRRLLERLHARPDAWDAIVTSGDVTRGEIAVRPGAPAYHLGPARDLPVFEGLDVTLTSETEAAYVVCTGLFDDDTETPANYAGLLHTLHARGLTMVCANPDLVVERGSQLIYCAGAIAEAYELIGGEAIYAGKPHAPIYERAIATAGEIRGRTAPPARILAIGDAIRTDIAGAARAGLDTLFVARGIHAAETLDAAGRIDRDRLPGWLAGQPHAPTMAIERLAW
ncbi:TIGR01459 family HAD-type hydrolase [Pseudochelatococcus sp. B33]